MFTNGTDNNLQFANFNGRTGAFVVRNADKSKSEFSQVRDVVITKVAVREDEYDGQPTKQLTLRVKDADGQSAQLSFNFNTGFTARLANILNGADLSKPLGISGSLRKAGSTYKNKSGETVTLSNDMVNISVWQGEGFLKPSAEVPKVNMVKVGNKEVADTTARDEFMQQQYDILAAKVTGDVAHPGTGSTAMPEAGAAAAELEDDIPF